MLQALKTTRERRWLHMSRLQLLLLQIRRVLRLLRRPRTCSEQPGSHDVIRR